MFINFLWQYKIYVLACEWHAQGSNSTECDSTGKCTCNANVINDKCTACKSEYFEFPDCKGNFIQNTYCNNILYNNFKFSACGCNAQGSSSIECDSNGFCTCKSNIVGTKCTDCASGYYGFHNCTG